MRFVFFLFLLNRAPGVWQKKPSRSARSLLCQSTLVLLSASLCEWHSYQLFNDTFCARKATKCSSVETPWYLNGIKQMWWVEYKWPLTWHRSQPLYSMMSVAESKGLVCCPLDCAVEYWAAWIWAQSHDQHDSCVSLSLWFCSCRIFYIFMKGWLCSLVYCIFKVISCFKYEMSMNMRSLDLYAPDQRQGQSGDRWCHRPPPSVWPCWVNKWRW